MGNAVMDFSAESTEGTVRAADLRGKPLVLYFYPRDNTPGCTTEGRDFSALHSQFKGNNTVIFGVSRDSLTAHEKFRARQEFPFHLISDPDEVLCKQFDVMREKNMYGRRSMGVERSTFVLNASGTIVREWRKVRVKGHAAEVLAFVQTLKG